MENESPTCGGCSIPYDTNDHTPRTMIHCGHTLCSHCLTKILSTKNERKCPLDDQYFDETQDSLEKFPVNPALLALVQAENQEICPTHDKKLKLFCEQDKMKICYDCALFGDHKGHEVNRIKEETAQAVEAKSDLQARLMKFAKSPQKVETLKKKKSPKAKNLKSCQRDEILKKRSFGQMEQKFGEINRLWKAKKQEWRNQMENFFEKNEDKPFSRKEEASEFREDAHQECHTEESLAQMNRDFSVIISRLQPQSNKKEVFELPAEAPKKKIAQATKSSESFELSDDKPRRKLPILKEQEQQQIPSPENLIETKQQLTLANSILKFGVLPGALKIWVGDSDPVHQSVDLDLFQDKKKVDVVIYGYDWLFKYSNNLNDLSEILHQLKSYTSLAVEFQDKTLTDDQVLSILNPLFPKIKHLTDLEISFEQCEITNMPVALFCQDIIPKATSLKHLILKLSSTAIDDLSLIALAQSLSSLNNSLETFKLEAGDTAVTDEGIERMLHAIERVKELDLNLWETDITDRSLKALGNSIMSSMKNLERFSLCVNRTNVTLEGVDAVFTGIPKDISDLSLTFYEINLPEDEVVSLVEEKLCPKLELVGYVCLEFEGKELNEKVSKILQKVRREAVKRRKSL